MYIGVSENFIHIFSYIVRMFSLVWFIYLIAYQFLKFDLFLKVRL